MAFGEHATTLVRLARRAFHEYQRQLWDQEISFEALDRSGEGKGAQPLAVPQSLG